MAWVDVLFILSAALATYHLLPPLEARPGTPPCTVVLAYWRRRAARILPLYLLANLAAVTAAWGPSDPPQEALFARYLHFTNCPTTLWANFLFAQNMLGVRACGELAAVCAALCPGVHSLAAGIVIEHPSFPAAIHLWTVALQVQFFAALPLLLCALRPRAPGFRARLAAALGVAVAAGTAWRVWAAWRIPFLELVVADFAVDEAAQLSWANMLQ